jgi:hypothetical protein
MTARVCYPEIENFLEYSSSTGKFSGVLAAMFHTFMEDTLMPILNNISYVGESNFGHVVDKNSLTYSGCVGSLQKNESDIMPLPHIYPITGPGLHQGPVCLSDSISLMSAYLNNELTRKSDVMESFSSFDLSVWMTLLFSLVITAIVFSVSHNMHYGRSHGKGRILQLKTTVTAWKGTRHRPDPIILETTSNLIIGSLLKQYSIINVSQNRGLRVLILSAIIFTFLIGHYFSTFIKTQLVTPLKPITITTYDEVLERPEVRPVWIQDLAEHDDFEYATQGSKPKAIWDKAVSMNISQSMAKGSEKDFLAFAIKIVKQEAVIFVKSSWMMFLFTGICAFSRNMDIFPNAIGLARIDEETKETLAGIPTGSEFYANNKKNSRLITHRVHHAFEEGLITKWISLLDFAMYKPTPGKLDEIRICLSNKIITKHTDRESPKIGHFSKLFSTYLALLIASSIILEIERLLFVDI